MKKTLIVIAVLTAVLMAASSVTFAYGGPGQGQSGAEHDTCIKEYLSETEQAQFMAVITDFKDRMLELRDIMRELREEGDFEAFLDVREKRLEAMEEKHDKLSEIVPDELMDRFESNGRNKRNTSRESGSGGFNKQKGTGH